MLSLNYIVCICQKVLFCMICHIIMMHHEIQGLCGHWGFLWACTSMQTLNTNPLHSMIYTGLVFRRIMNVTHCSIEVCQIPKQTEKNQNSLKATFRLFRLYAVCYSLVFLTFKNILECKESILRSVLRFYIIFNDVG